MMTKEMKLAVLKKALDNDNINTHYFNLQVMEILDSRDRNVNGPHFFDRDKKPDTKGYSNAIRRNQKRS